MSPPPWKSKKFWTAVWKCGGAASLIQNSALPAADHNFLFLFSFVIQKSCQTPEHDDRCLNDDDSSGITQNHFFLIPLLPSDGTRALHPPEPELPTIPRTLLSFRRVLRPPFSVKKSSSSSFSHVRSPIPSLLPPTTKQSLFSDTMEAKLYAPATAPLTSSEKLVTLELQDGVVYQGYSFGAPKSIAGELVFQTGMVGYPESVTDPSYRGQILVITFPLVGNYGVPSRETMCELLKDLPAHFESHQIHIAGLVVATYAGEDYSHYLATSSLGAWLKEEGIPAMYGVDTRALTKRIREEGSMLGRMLLQNDSLADLAALNKAGQDWRPYFEQLEWVDPNKKNLVAEGEFRRDLKSASCSPSLSVHQEAQALQPPIGFGPQALYRPADSYPLSRRRYEVQPAQMLPQAWR